MTPWGAAREATGTDSLGATAPPTLSYAIDIGDDDDDDGASCGPARLALSASHATCCSSKRVTLAGEARERGLGWLRDGSCVPRLASRQERVLHGCVHEV